MLAEAFTTRSVTGAGEAGIAKGNWQTRELVHPVRLATTLLPLGFWSGFGQVPSAKYNSNPRAITVIFNTKSDLLVLSKSNQAQKTLACKMCPALRHV